jgi:hypothetical protein
MGLFRWRHSIRALSWHTNLRTKLVFPQCWWRRGPARGASRSRRAVCVKPRVGLAMSRVAHETILVYPKSGSARCALADSYLLLAALIADGTKEEEGNIPGDCGRRER